MHVRGHVCVPCAYACLCICVRGSEAGRAGMYFFFFITLHIPTEEGGDKTKTKQKRQQCISVLLQSHGYIQYIARAWSSCLPSGLGWGGNGKRTEIIHIKPLCERF